MSFAAKIYIINLTIIRCHSSTVKIFLGNLESPVTIIFPGFELEENMGLTQYLLLIIFQVNLVSVSNVSLQVFFIRI